MAEVHLTGLSKSHGKQSVLCDLSLRVAAGEMAVVVGPSGCGKTTLLRLIAGLDQPDAGRVRIGGQPVDHLPPDRRGVAMVFQSHALYPHMTVAENMGFALRLAGRPRSEIASDVARIAALLQLEPLLGRRPAALSGGQRQRVAIGRAILRDPRVFLFDEPLSSLDPGLRATLRAEIAALKDRLPDRTMILVTHDQAEAMVLADQLVVMVAGAIEQAGSPVDIYQRPRTSFVATFIGAPGMNLLPAKVIGIDDQARLRLAGGARRCVRCPFGPRISVGRCCWGCGPRICARRRGRGCWAVASRGPRGWARRPWRISTPRRGRWWRGCRACIPACDINGWTCRPRSTGCICSSTGCPFFIAKAPPTRRARSG